MKSAKVPNVWKFENVFLKMERKNPIIIDQSLSCHVRVKFQKELMVFKNLLLYLRKINFILQHQSGFQSDDSTVNQLTYLYTVLAKALDEKKDIYSILFFATSPKCLIVFGTKVIYINYEKLVYLVIYLNRLVYRLSSCMLSMCHIYRNLNLV